MDEYFYKKIVRVGIVFTGTVSSVILLAAGAVVSTADPVFGLTVMSCTLLMLSVTAVFAGDNTARRVHNGLFSDSVTEIKRPDEQRGEVVADD